MDDYWGPAKKKLLGDVKFLENLQNYDKDNMDPEMVVKVTHSYSCLLRKPINNQAAHRSAFSHLR